MKWYAGIGSRSTPPHVLDLMTRIGCLLARRGWVLRSGYADGADQAFMRGATEGGGAVEAWRGSDVRRVADWAAAEARKHCTEKPYDDMGVFSRLLIGRDMYQIHGEGGADPVSFVLCWTPQIDPCHPDSGGTRYACRAAVAAGIRVHNLSDRLTFDRWDMWAWKQGGEP